jgi:hypothetical protein
MMRNSSAVLSLFLALAVIACAQKATRSAKGQGICGTVSEKRGNHMPSPDSPPSKGHPVEREILIFPLLNISQIEVGDNGFIKSVGAVKPIETVKSDKAGKFCVSLPVGRYSVVVREPKGLYANLFDAQNNIFPVTVKKGKQETVSVEITHQAVF